MEVPKVTPRKHRMIAAKAGRERGNAKARLIRALTVTGWQRRFAAFAALGMADPLYCQPLPRTLCSPFPKHPDRAVFRGKTVVTGGEET